MPDASLLTSLFGEEVVTRALVRDVELPDGAGTMALITLDNGRDHTRPSTFGPAGLLALNDALGGEDNGTAVLLPTRFDVPDSDSEQGLTLTFWSPSDRLEIWIPAL